MENKDNEVGDADNDSGGGVNVDDDAHDDNDDDVITCRQAW